MSRRRLVRQVKTLRALGKCADELADRVVTAESNLRSVETQYAWFLDTLRSRGFKIPRSTSQQAPMWQVAQIIVQTCRKRKGR